VTLGHVHFYGKLFVPKFCFPYKAAYQVEVSSSSSFGDIDAAMGDMTLNDLYTNFGTNRLPIGCE